MIKRVKSKKVVKEYNIPEEKNKKPELKKVIYVGSVCNNNIIGYCYKFVVNKKVLNKKGCPYDNWSYSALIEQKYLYYKELAGIIMGCVEAINKAIRNNCTELDIHYYSNKPINLNQDDTLVRNFKEFIEEKQKQIKLRFTKMSKTDVNLEKLTKICDKAIEQKTYQLSIQKRLFKEKIVNGKLKAIGVYNE